AQRPQQPEAFLLRARVCALVWQDDSGRIGLGAQSTDEPRTRPRDAVRPDVVLLEPPAGGLLVAREDAFGLPRSPETGGALLVLGERQMDDVVGALGQITRALLRPQHVVGRRDQRQIGRAHV